MIDREGASGFSLAHVVGLDGLERRHSFVDGPEAEQALEALDDLVGKRFGEDE